MLRNFNFLSLPGYLESKRLIFPRFFFVSDPVLLEIFGQASDPTTIQPHLLSIFDAVATVTFAPKSSHQIIGINSANKEHVRQFFRWILIIRLRFYLILSNAD